MKLRALFGKIALVLCLAVFLEIPKLAQAEQVNVCGTHHVVAGDTLSQIAERELHHARMYELIATANGITNPDRIYVGTDLKIPCPTVNAKSQTSTNGVDDMNMQAVKKIGAVTLMAVAAVTSQPQPAKAQTNTQLTAQTSPAKRPRVCRSTTTTDKIVPCPGAEKPSASQAAAPRHTQAGPSRPTALGEKLVETQRLQAQADLAKAEAERLEAERDLLLAQAILAGNKAQEMTAHVIADDHDRMTLQEQNSLAINTAIAAFGEGYLLNAKTAQGQLALDADLGDRAMTVAEKTQKHGARYDWGLLPARYLGAAAQLATIWRPGFEVNQSTSQSSVASATGGSSASSASAVAVAPPATGTVAGHVNGGKN